MSNALKALKFGPIIPELYSFPLYEGKIGRVILLFSTNEFDGLASALIEKYGKPTTDTVQVLQNRMGAKFDNRVIMWIRPDATMGLFQRGSDVDHGFLSMTSMEYDAYAAKKKGDDAKKSAGDL